MITRTGWTFKQVDDMPLVRVMDLLEYWRREYEWQKEAMQAAQEGREFEPSKASWHEPTEEEATAMFNAMPRSAIDRVGVAQDITRIPEDLREMIRWAEEKKQKHAVN